MMLQLSSAPLECNFGLTKQKKTMTFKLKTDQTVVTYLGKYNFVP